VKELNRDFKLAGKKRLLDLSSLDEWRNEAYENANFSKRKSNNGMIREFLRESFMLVRKFYRIGPVSDFLQENYSRNGKDLMLLRKYRSGAIKIASLKDDTTQVVNGQRLKHYIAGDSYNEDVDVIQMVSPEEFIQDNMQEPAEFIFQIGNSSSQKRFALNFFSTIFIVFAKYEKSRDENGQETETRAPSHTGGAGPPLAVPPWCESTPELISVPFSSCDFASMFNFHLYNPPDCPRFVYRVFVVFLFRAVSVRGLFSALELQCLRPVHPRRTLLRISLIRT
jgi:hypothetical protein